MVVSISSSPIISSTIRQSFSGIRVPGHAKPFANGVCKSRSDRLNGKVKSKWRISVMDGVSAAADPGQAEVTWQTVVGAIGGHCKRSTRQKTGAFKHELLQSLGSRTVASLRLPGIARVRISEEFAYVLRSYAGVTPFVVAGIEFSKRIIAQRRCEVCGGSGLVLRDKYYFRCPGCGGFLPWQSWKRFFSG